MALIGGGITVDIQPIGKNLVMHDLWRVNSVQGIVGLVYLGALDLGHGQLVLLLALI